ncbi:MAG: hypothetical protein ACD_11C00018G0043 [uncultured bacterium]|nr:MAG: hypothetical protein ACD_11C00018G0043 [uncultured bacterium]HBR71568.1 hypothetical protein [Candidatus Moranbacteria bacterium]
MNKKIQAKKEITLDDLALMVAKGFNEVNEKMDNGFKNVTERLDKVETDVQTLKTDVTEIKLTVNNIKADLNKKVDKIDHNTLTYQVERLEKKFA